MKLEAKIIFGDLYQTVTITPEDIDQYETYWGLPGFYLGRQMTALDQLALTFDPSGSVGLFCYQAPDRIVVNGRAKLMFFANSDVTSYGPYDMPDWTEGEDYRISATTHVCSTDYIIPWSSIQAILAQQ